VESQEGPETMTNPLLKGLLPTHPGEILREDILPALDAPKTKVAQALRISRQTLYKILDEKAPVTPSMALRLARAFGTSPEFWCNLQQAYDIAAAARKEAGVIGKVQQLRAA
jgi:addiction module HigA family antidote